MTDLLLSVAEITVTMAIVILLLLLVNRAAGERFTAKCRYILWCVVMIRLAIPIGAPFHTALIRLEVPAAFTVQEESVSEPSGDFTEIPESAGSQLIPNEPTAETEVPEQTELPSYTKNETSTSSAVESFTAMLIKEAQNETESVSTLQNPAEHVEITVDEPVRKLDVETLLIWATAVYLAAAVLFFAVHFIEHLYKTKSLRRSRRTVSREMNAVYQQQCGQCGIQKQPHLYASVKVSSPILFGYFRPCVLLPLNVTEPEKASGILRHELTHWKRGDLWIKLICLVAQSLHWFNPLVHIAAGRCVREMELSCDEAVLEGLDRSERQEYGLVMLDVVRFCRKRHSGLTTQFNPKRNVVFERFENILDTRRKNRGIVLIALVLTVSLCAGMVISCTVRSDSENDFTLTGSEISGMPDSSDSETNEIPKKINPALVKEAYKNDKPMGEVRTITGTELEAVNTAFAAVGKMKTEYRIEYQEMLDCLAAWRLNEEKTVEEKATQLFANQDTDTGHEFANQARIYREEFLYAVKHLEKQVPSALFCRDDLRILIPGDYVDQVVVLPGSSETEFAVVYRKNGDSVEEMFRIIRLTVEKLLPVEEFDLDTTYIACDAQYYYAVQYPYHVEDELRDTMLQSVRNTFVSCNSTLKSVTSSRVNTIARDLADASYSLCWANITNEIWKKSDVIHSDVVKGISARLVNRVLEYLEQGKTVGGIKVAGVELSGNTANTIELELPDGLQICEPLMAESMDTYFAANRYNPDSLIYRIPMGNEYTLEIDFNLSQSQIHFKDIRLLHHSQMPQYSINTPSEQLYALYREGKLTSSQLMQYPAAQFDFLQIAEEVMENVANNDTRTREGYSTVKLSDGQKLYYPTQTEICEYFRSYTDDGIIFIYKCASGVYARIDVTVGSRMEFSRLIMGSITDLITDYGMLYTLYQVGEIKRNTFYGHDTVSELGAELVNSVLSSLRRRENPNTLFGGAAYGENITHLPEGSMIQDVRAFQMKSYLVESADFNYITHPYACYQVPLLDSNKLEIWFELHEGGMRGICVRLADKVPDQYANMAKSTLYKLVLEGETNLHSIIEKVTVRHDLLTVYRDTILPLLENRFTEVVERWDSDNMTLNNSTVTRMLAVSAMGNPVLCYSPDGKTVYEIGLKLTGGEDSGKLEASYLTMKKIGESRFTVLTDCSMDGRQMDCTLSLPPVYGFDSVKIHGFTKTENGKICVAELIRGNQSVFILGDVVETVGQTVICSTGDSLNTITETEAEKLLSR